MLDANNNLTGCAVVSTVFRQEGRAYTSFDDWLTFGPHGFPTDSGKTATAAMDGTVSPVYFNSDVQPDPTVLSTSSDGGVVWTHIPAGRHTFTASDTFGDRFASFVADCVPGRFINANPPWGLYQLSANEVPNPATLAASAVVPNAVTPAVKLAAPASVAYGAPVPVTVTTSGGTGVVLVKDGATTVGAKEVTVSSGASTVVVSGLGVGAHTLTARFRADGDSPWTSSTPAKITIHKAATAIKLKAPHKAVRKKKVTVRVQVSSATTTPAGTVTLYRGAKKLHPLTLKGGTATARIAFPKAGRHKLHAVYSGSGVTDPASSTVVHVRVRR